MRPDELAALVRSALAGGAPASAASSAHAAMRALAERSCAGEREAFVRHHDLLWDLHADPDHGTYGLRWWLCQASYAVEEAHVVRVELDAALGPAEFARRAEEEVTSGPPHPMAQHLFSDASTLDEMKVYLRHHWHRSRLFWRELGELALGRRLAEAAVLLRNLYDEAGGEVDGGAHPFLLQRLLAHLGLPHGFDERPTWPEAQAYLNNRIRCARHPNPAWGLAVLFALEYGTPANHGRIYRALRRLGVAEEYCEFHRLHMTADVEHAAETLALVGRLVVGADDQRTFLSAIRHHRGLGRRYFDEIWREIASGRQP